MISFPTLVYHRVCGDAEWFASSYVVRASAFRHQMEYLVRHNWHAASVSDLFPPRVGEDKPRRSVLITFDDGYLDTYTTAFPILRDLGLSALVFLVGDMSRRNNWWDVPLGVPEARLLTPDQIAEMAEAGFQFGSHTMTHRSLPGSTPAQLHEELVGSKVAIERITRKTVAAFSYPYSHIDEKSKQAVRNAGYDCAFAVNSGPLRPLDDRFEIRRVNVSSTALGSRFGLKLNGVEKCLIWTWWKGKQVMPKSGGYEIRRGF